MSTSSTPTSAAPALGTKKKGWASIKNAVASGTSFKDLVSADAKKAKTKHTLAATLASSNPLSSDVWWWLKHPVVRMINCIFVLIVNLYVYLGDPASFSSAKSYGTLVGDIYHGFFDPDDPGWLLLRLLVMFVLGGLGIWAGVYIQQKWLRDYFKLVLFGYDNGSNPDRDPVVDQDGAFFVCGACMSMLWYIGLAIYGAILQYAEVDEKHWVDGGMHGLTFASYNLILAGLFTFVCDWYAVIAVADQMLQGIALKEGTGYLAYGEISWLAKASEWWEPRRIGATRILLLVGWPPVVTLMMVNYFDIMEKLTVVPKDLEDSVGTTVGAQWAWSMEWNTEYMRMLAAALVAFCNLAIVAQDWDFPDFSGEDIKIVAVDFSSFQIRLPDCCIKMLSRFPSISKYFVLYISAKWFNYFGIMMGVAFDWAYWFMTALCFRPCDYAHLWDSETGYIYNINDEKFQDRFAGHQSAKNCSAFTDNGVQAYFKERLDANDPFVVRVDTGIFTGAYTIDEQDEFVFTGKAAVSMWLMCIPPLFGWVAVAWLIFTHEKVTCFNYHKVISFFEAHDTGDHSDVHDFDPSADLATDATESQRSVHEKQQRQAAGLQRTMAAAKAAKDGAKAMAAYIEKQKAACFGIVAHPPCCAAKEEPPPTEAPKATEMTHKAC